MSSKHPAPPRNNHREIPCAPLTPATRFLFDDSASTSGGRASLLEHPLQIIRADHADEVPQALDQLQQTLENGHHAAGFFSYELGYALEPSLRPLMPQRRELPLIWFGVFDRCETLGGAELARFFENLTSEGDRSTLENLRPLMSRKDYLARFSRAMELIAAGDIYQVNLTFQLGFDVRGSAVPLYQTLRQRQPVPCGALLESPEFSILSLSPELFFEVQEGEIITRPMKGTMRRGLTDKEDQKLSQRLQADIKNRAENLMIVDLMRNDLARICEIGSVKTSDLYQVEAYPTLHQMTSKVRGRLRSSAQLEDLIRALVPAGSITGAPKIRAQQIIRELEDVPRGVYCGAMGVLNLERASGALSARFNVAIRTLTVFADGRGQTGIGSGLVQDSDGEAEYEECLLKAKFLTLPDYQLIETMRLEHGEVYLLENHLARLQRSSRELGFLVPDAAIRARLDELVSSLHEGCYLVRLLLFSGGKVTFTSKQIEPPDPEKTITYTISDQRVDSGDPLLAHKTTKRQLFDEQWASANKRHGTGEVLFLNERDELTEGARSSLFIERNGQLVTPSLSCGLLRGTLREQLIGEGRAHERVLKRADLEGAKIWFGNSVRGLQPARRHEEK